MWITFLFILMELINICLCLDNMKLKHGNTYRITYSDLVKYPQLAGTLCICSSNWVILLDKYAGEMISLDLIGIITVEFEPVNIF